ncbi:MAG TPA: hypothetical protein VMJ65_21170 [Solirubrobacteraceae bacterium]|nr:hypothetical protein [Solirubrobacteraceae bacterium]
MAALIGATIGGLRFNHAPLAFEQQTEAESAITVAEMVGATISRLGLGQRPLLFEQSTEVRGGGATATLIGVTVGRMRFNHAPKAGELLTEVESAGGLVRLGKMPRSSPSQPAFCAIVDARRTRFGGMSVGVNLGPIGSGDGLVVALRRRIRCPRRHRRQCVAVHPLREGKPALAAGAHTANRSDDQTAEHYQCQRQHETGQDGYPRHAARATPGG